MNRYSLTFTNQKLEQDYQTYIAVQHRIWMLGWTKQFILLSVSFSIPSILLQQYLVFGLAMIIFVGCCCLIYFQERIHTKYLILAYQSFTIIAPELLYTVVYLTGYDPSMSVNIIISMVIFPSIFTNTTNILHAVLQIVHNFSVVIITITQIYEDPLYIISWQPFLIIWIYTYHQKILVQRNLFQESLINESIYELIKKTTAQDTMLFNYNTELSNFKLIISNIDNCNLQEFLKHNYVKAQQLSTYLYQKYFKVSDYHFLDEITLINNKVTFKKLQIHIFVQQYPKLVFFIKILQNHHLDIEPIVYEHKLITSSLKKLYLHHSEHQMKQSQFMLIELMIKLGLHRISSMINKYVLKVDKIYIDDFLTELSCIMGISLERKDNQNKNQIIQTDKLLLQNLILGLFIFIRKKNTFVEYTITNSQIELNIALILERSVSFNTITSQKYLAWLNQILLKLSFDSLQIQQHSISFSITHSDYQRFQ